VPVVVQAFNRQVVHPAVCGLSTQAGMGQGNIQRSESTKHWFEKGLAEC
jgi:hypothetical protein